MLILRSNKYIIAVNERNTPNRQRFTVAHECGHLILGHKLNEHVDQSFFINRDGRSSVGTDKDEVEANQFAAELLMPLRFLLRDLDGVDFEAEDGIRKVANKYQVSATAMSFRIANVFL